MKVSADGLSVAIKRELQEYSDDVKTETASALKKIGTTALKKLRETSPRRTGEYQKNWAQTVTDTGSQVSISIHNKKYGFLTHLLENGHAKANGGRVEGIPHIKPVQNWANEAALDAITKILEGR